MFGFRADSLWSEVTALTNTHCSLPPAVLSPHPPWLCFYLKSFLLKREFFFPPCHQVLLTQNCFYFIFLCRAASNDFLLSTGAIVTWRNLNESFRQLVARAGRHGCVRCVSSVLWDGSFLWERTGKCFPPAAGNGRNLLAQNYNSSSLSCEGSHSW